jgi:hypothetical protein
MRVTVGSRQVYWISCMFEFGTAPNCRREKIKLCPVICMRGLAQPQLQMWARCSTAVFLRCLRLERSSHSFLRSQGLQCPPPPLRNASPPQVATVYNKRTEGGGCWCVSIQAHSLPGPSFVHVWSFVCLSFLSSPVAPQLRFLGQACVGLED